MTNTAQEEYLMGFHANFLCRRHDVKGFNTKFAKSPFTITNKQLRFLCGFSPYNFIVKSKHTYEELSSTN